MNNTVNDQLHALMLYLQGAYAPNTLRAYRADMQEFILFCENHTLAALPASSATVASFLMGTLTQGIKTATIRRKASSISAIHRLSLLPDPTKHPEVVQEAKRQYWHLYLSAATVAAGVAADMAAAQQAAAAAVAPAANNPA